MPTPAEMLKLTSEEPVIEEDVVLRFDEPNAPYWVGETARFTKTEAQPYIDRKKAVVVQTISVEEILAERAARAAVISIAPPSIGVAPTGTAPAGQAAGQSKR